eukprot:2514365-Amphidinium_carterae.1
MPAYDPTSLSFLVNVSCRRTTVAKDPPVGVGPQVVRVPALLATLGSAVSERSRKKVAKPYAGCSGTQEALDAQVVASHQHVCNSVS